jgi:hypothetical protein
VPALQPCRTVIGPSALLCRSRPNRDEKSVNYPPPAGINGVAQQHAFLQHLRPCTSSSYSLMMMTTITKIPMLTSVSEHAPQHAWSCWNDDVVGVLPRGGFVSFSIIVAPPARRTTGPQH